MIRTKFAAATVTALAAGGMGAGLANAAPNQAPAPPTSQSVQQHPTAHHGGQQSTTAGQGSNAQQGKQQGREKGSANEANEGAEHAEGPDHDNIQQGPNVQQGNQNAPEGGNQAESGK
jgi:hypothetical protein